jgi:hypothetical protein
MSGNYMRKLMESVTLAETAKDNTDVLTQIISQNASRAELMQDAEPRGYEKGMRQIESANQRAQQIVQDTEEVSVVTNPYSKRGTFYRGLGIEGGPEQVVNWINKHWPRANINKIISEAEGKAEEAGTEIEWSDATAMLRAKETDPWRIYAPAYMLVMNGQTTAGHDVVLYFDSVPKMATKKLVVDGQTMSGVWGSYIFEE